jgi:hypothetical protein
MEQDTQPLCTEIPAADLSSVTDLHFWDPDHEASTLMGATSKKESPK